ncbi:MAG TPA: UDP-N-acetylmuramyl-tripeptide synthetase [Anaerolineales bacterium]|nr:UDP-N-acetylmuramyl-tripeptide synthetase [Anaerolineales bacterium]
MSKIRAFIYNFYHWTKAVLAVAVNRYPAGGLTVIGVTGTDGKTTTSHILHAILLKAGVRTTLISTTGAVVYGRENEDLDLHVTTPSPFKLQKILREARRAGSTHIILESTSHGLAQHRVLGCNFRIGVLTNVTEEHLDYHGTYDRYLRDKARLFRKVETSILNRDDRSYPAMSGLAAGRQITYGLSKDADFRAEGIAADLSGTRFSIPRLGLAVRSQLLAEYNIYNMLAASAAASAIGIETAAIAAGLEAARPPKGRLEPVGMGQPFTVFVDFAHTSNGLDQMLQKLRPLVENQLIVVFGCAGLRDPNKRYPMGVSAGKYADKTVLTAEDPRTEDLDEIIDRIAEGVESQGGVLGETYFRVKDRAAAIAFAIRELARPGDVVVCTGKAHEKSMNYGNGEEPWDEFAAVHAALSPLSEKAW